MDQREILIALYNANPGNTLGWDIENLDVSNLNGVTTDENNSIIELFLQNRNLTTIPAEIGQLSKLTKLNLYENQITELPAEIGQLTNLIELSLSKNKITTITEEIWQLTNLTRLNLTNNQLTVIPY